MSDQGKRSRRGYMYTPFGGAQALDSAMGENMARLTSRKAPMGLIAPNHEMADKLEQLRQTTLNVWGAQIGQSQQVLGGVQARRQRTDADFLAAIRASVDTPGATALDTRNARRDAREDHQFNNMMIGNDALVHQARLSTLQPRHEALFETKVKNTSPGIYPDLFPDPPLRFLQGGDTPYSSGDKLYVLGHGAPGKNRLFARSDGQGGSLSAKKLAKHLRDAGLPTDMMDVRLTACQGVPALDETIKDPVKDTQHSGYLVPEVARAFHGLGFQNLTVTGYQGNGVTFPFGSQHHLRSSPDDDEERVKRSLAAVRYPVKDMGD
ncbi:MAG: hypothetical protein KF800_03515 [Lysobacter sp.]|nr:hypothetical protein [Lysobacter sp.]